MGDLKSFQERYIALRLSMIDDGIDLGLPIHVKDLSNLTERLEKEGTSFVKVTLPLLGKALDRGLVEGRFIPIPHFSRKRNTQLPSFMYSLFKGIFDDEGALLAHPDVTSIRYLRLFLLFDSKLYSEPTDKQAEDTVQGFRDRMANNRKVVIPRSNPVLLEAKRLLGSVLRPLDLSNIIPGHGPGAVAEKKERDERWDFRSWPKKAENVYPYYIYGTHSLRATLENKVGIALSPIGVTRCCLVPKDFKGPRLISAENTVNQYLQQGQMKALMSYIEDHPLLSKSIRLRDQSFNQKLASEAYGRCLDTLDLSNASDTVSATLVWYLLSEVPKLRRQLFSTRSDYMDYKGSRIRISAFAPMGSATCFPVETLVFWALTMATVRQTHLHPITHLGTRSYSEISSSVGVFGDDIILPSVSTDLLIYTLRSVGCEPNMSKTCRNTPFRESCGSEWYGNIDVTIIRNRKFQYWRCSIVDQPVLCDLQRKFFSKGYYKTAAFLSALANSISPMPTVAMSSVISNTSLRSMGWEGLNYARCNNPRLMSEVIPSLTFFERESLASDKFPFLLGFWPSIPRGCCIRWSKTYHRWECRVARPYQGMRDWSLGGYSRLLARLTGDSADRIAIRTDRKVKMAWSFIPFFLDFHQEE
jgi:hypothetical protein